MDLTENTQVILLLTAYFSKPVKGAVTPLTPTEWGRFAIWLHENKLMPADLLSADLVKCLGTWQDKKISISRIEELLARGHALALAIEKWSRAGIWVLTRSDAEYPAQLRQRLKPNAPPIFFGCGNIKLLNSSGIAVVGSRNVTEADLQFTAQLSEKASAASKVVISGGGQRCRCCCDAGIFAS